MNPNNSIWWERVTAGCAVAALVATLSASHISCANQDLIFSGEFPTETPVRTTTATMTETPDPDEEVF
jgi:hypothetical protein